MNVLSRKEVSARKQHRCGYCGCAIEKGERYEEQRCVSGGSVYTFRAHLRCQSLCDKIWDYVDPCEGMTEDDFGDAVQSLMSTFYCPFHCDAWERDIQDCNCGFDYDVCVRRFAKFMETRQLVQVVEPGRGIFWKIAQTEEKQEGGRT